MSDLVFTIATVFARKSGTEMSVSAFKHALSLDLRWFTPAEARRVLMHAADVGLVRVDGDTVTAAFDVTEVRVPVNFRPSATVLEERPPVPGAAPEAPAESEGEAPAPAGADEASGEPPAAPEALVDRVLKAAAHTSMEDLADVRRAFEEEKTRRGHVFDDDVVALVVARRRGVDVTRDAESLLAERGDADA